ncbi:MAG: homoserine dehydrogenase, partial [Ruthenibacterium sp.]
EPCLVPRTNQLAGVEDVFNEVLVKGDMLGDVVFYGKGAGKLPTASAVVADVIDALKNGTSIHDSLFWRESLPMEGTYRDSGEYDFYVRVSHASAATVQTAFDALGTLEVLDGADGLDGDVAFLVRSVTGDALLDCCGKARAAGLVVQNTLKRLPE